MLSLVYNSVDILIETSPRFYRPEKFHAYEQSMQPQPPKRKLYKLILFADFMQLMNHDTRHFLALESRTNEIRLNAIGNMCGTLLHVMYRLCPYQADHAAINNSAFGPYLPRNPTRISRVSNGSQLESGSAQRWNGFDKNAKP
ncbi:hypothetical protein PsorP6_000722 [Peronosclerospora sorghi]|uniref:Uncharacterized protein n=1 Tax=Peronosclerospora sorghi TaxID=230839 RepID=A0ACC0WWV3_9STRA|nr:hypothetical protein PsorP6_000722 [Peronosclerospora sorghi]